MLGRLISRLWPSDQLTVRQQFSLATGLLCLAMIIASAGSATFLGRSTTEALTQNQMAEIADTMLDNLQRGIFERFRELRLLARLEATTNVLTKDGDRARLMLEHVQDGSGVYAWIRSDAP